MMIDIVSILTDMPEYVVMRIWDRFPSYDVPHDIDVVCRDIEQCVTHIVGRVHVARTDVGSQQVHLDVMDGDKVHFKFDLYGHYISEQFTQDVLDNRRISSIHGVYIPWEPHNLISKYYEYRISGKEKYKRYEYYKYLLDEYITL